MKSNISIWLAVNKNGFVEMFYSEPTKNESTGRWEGIPFINSLIYKDFLGLVEKTQLSWEHSPEPFTINF